jgi:hypothetical protein
MDKELYLGKISHTIMAYDRSIIGVKALSFVKIFGFTKNNYDFISALITEGKVNELADIQEPEVAPKGEDLMVMKFTDQNDNARLALVYDSDELSRDPTVMKIF